ncbi:MAG TPA: glycosyltransferase [Pengzhenrongella sp.]
MTHPPDGDGASIDVLMATYNGERFIAEQIESILRQSHPDWKLTVRDDCSTDGTCAIVRDYARRRPDRIGAAGLARSARFTWARAAEQTVVAYRAAL